MTLDDRLRGASESLRNARIDIPPFRVLRRRHRVRLARAVASTVVLVGLTGAVAVAAAGSHEGVSVTPAATSPTPDENSTTAADNTTSSSLSGGPATDPKTAPAITPGSTTAGASAQPPPVSDPTAPVTTTDPCPAPGFGEISASIAFDSPHVTIGRDVGYTMIVTNLTDSAFSPPYDMGLITDASGDRPADVFNGWAAESPVCFMRWGRYYLAPHASVRVTGRFRPPAFFLDGGGNPVPFPAGPTTVRLAEQGKFPFYGAVGGAGGPIIIDAPDTPTTSTGP